MASKKSSRKSDEQLLKDKEEEHKRTLKKQDEIVNKVKSLESEIQELKNSIILREITKIKVNLKNERDIYKLLKAIGEGNSNLVNNIMQSNLINENKEEKASINNPLDTINATN